MLANVPIVYSFSPSILPFPTKNTHYRGQYVYKSFFVLWLLDIKRIFKIHPLSTLGLFLSGIPFVLC